MFSRVELPPTWAHVFSGPDHPQVTIESRPNFGSAASSGPVLQTRLELACSKRSARVGSVVHVLWIQVTLSATTLRFIKVYDVSRLAFHRDCIVGLIGCIGRRLNSLPATW